MKPEFLFRVKFSSSPFNILRSLVYREDVTSLYDYQLVFVTKEHIEENGRTQCPVNF
jgi:hypothetical protein